MALQNIHQCILGNNTIQCYAYHATVSTWHQVSGWSGTKWFRTAFCLLA